MSHQMITPPQVIYFPFKNFKILENCDSPLDRMSSHLSEIDDKMMDKLLKNDLEFVKKEGNTQESPKSSKPSNIQPMYFYYNNTLKKTNQTINRDSRYDKKLLKEADYKRIDSDSNLDVELYEEIRLQTKEFLFNNKSTENSRVSTEI